MKFSDYFAAPGVRPLSLILGVLIGGGTALFKGLLFGAFVGAVTILLASLILPVWAFLSDLPYIRIKKTLPRPFLLDERVDYVINGKRVYGFFVLTEERMVMISISNGKRQMELPREKVFRVVKEENYCIKIYVNQKDYIQIQAPTFERIYEILSEKGWL